MLVSVKPGQIALMQMSGPSVRCSNEAAIERMNPTTACFVSP